MSRSKFLIFVYIISENNMVFDVIFYVHIIPNIYGIICALVNTYKDVIIHT